MTFCASLHARSLGDDVLDSKAAVHFASLTVLAAACALILIVLLSGLEINRDCAVHLQCAQLLLAGRIPYLDYVELNPPLAHYIHVLPVLLARWVGQEVVIVFHTMVMGMALVSAALFFVIISRTRAVKSRVGSLLMTAAWLVFSLFVLISGEFGQREHLFLLGYLPWLYCREGHYRGARLPKALTVTSGIFAGLFLLLKPHFVLIVAII